jgi:Flp pilus assembly protein TadG
MVETAIVMSVVLLLLFGIIDFGRAIYTYSFVATVAREGARWMIVRGSQSCTGPIDNCNAQSSNLQTYVRGLNNGVLDSSKLTATATFSACPSGAAAGNGQGCTVNVTVTYNPFLFIAPFVSKASISMTSTSKMVISQ